MKKFFYAIAFTFLILCSLYLYGEVAIDKLTTEENFSKASANRTSQLKTVGTFLKLPLELHLIVQAQCMSPIGLSTPLLRLKPVVSMKTSIQIFLLLPALRLMLMIISTSAHIMITIF